MCVVCELRILLVFLAFSIYLKKYENNEWRWYSTYSKTKRVLANDIVVGPIPI